MSAVAIARPVGPSVRPTLRLVGARACPDSSADAPSHAVSLRLTRRGRLVRTLVTFFALALLASLAVARIWVPGSLCVDHVATVQPGQTLSQIAAAELPGRSIGEGVAMLREVNDMDSTVLIAGQSLLIPAG